MKEEEEKRMRRRKKEGGGTKEKRGGGGLCLLEGHTKRMSLSCSHCGKEFSRTDNLKRHVRSKHAENVIKRLSILEPKSSRSHLTMVRGTSHEENNCNISTATSFYSLGCGNDWFRKNCLGTKLARTCHRNDFSTTSTHHMVLLSMATRQRGNATQCAWN